MTSHFLIPLLLSLILPTQKIHFTNSSHSSRVEESNKAVTFSSSQIVTSSAYQLYEDENWVLTLGGNNNAVGVSNTYASRAVLSDYINVAAFNKDITDTTKYLSAVISKNTIRNLSSIRIGRSGSSLGAYLNTKVYLSGASSLEDDFELVTTIETVSTSVIEYNFPIINEEQYYALVFYNPNGSFLLANVAVDFYSASEIEKYVKVESSEDLYFGATYTLVNEEHNRVISEIDENGQISSVEVEIINNYFTSDSSVLSFILDYGSEIGTYSLNLNYESQNVSYLSISDDKLIQAPTKDKNNAFSLTFENQEFNIYNLNQNKTIGFNNNEFEALIGTSNVSLYRMDNIVDHLIEASYLVEAILNEGEHAKGRCEETYYFLENIYSRLSVKAVEEFYRANDYRFVEAKSRFEYMNTWLSSKERKSSYNINRLNSNIIPYILILGIVTSTISLFYALKKQRHNDNF
ncbi:MAG: hypothetical protein RBQ97_11855 [Acholeplasma sp.]|nr:hypothetical protein [Acholeplasma sp.]